MTDENDRNQNHERVTDLFQQAWRAGANTDWYDGTLETFVELAIGVGPGAALDALDRAHDPRWEPLRCYLQAWNTENQRIGASEDALAGCHALLDRFDVPQTDAGDASVRLLARLGKVVKLAYRRETKHTSEQIDAMPKDAFAPFSAYGMELRGLLGDVISGIEIYPRDDGEYDTRIAFRASCVETGIAAREVIFTGRCEVNELGETIDGKGLTPEQTIIKLVLYRMLVHEIAEDLRINGRPLAYTHPTEAPDLSRRDLRIDGTPANASAKIAVLETELAQTKAELATLRATINTPATDAFMHAIPLEAAHQITRWSAPHDDGKAPEDWLWLLGHLAGKAVHAARTGDLEKARHHTISSAAVLLNWHRRLAGEDQSFRPGIAPPGTLRARTVCVDAGVSLTVVLDDGRSLTTPLHWFPCLCAATRAQQLNHRLIVDGTGIRWPEIDEAMSVYSVWTARPPATETTP